MIHIIIHFGVQHVHLMSFAVMPKFYQLRWVCAHVLVSEILIHIGRDGSVDY